MGCPCKKKTPQPPKPQEHSKEEKPVQEKDKK